MGRDIALRLAAQGQTVVIVGRREEPQRQTAAAARGGCIEVVVADVSTVEGARSLVAAIGDRAVTGMVAAAGGQGDSGDDASPEAVRARWVAALDKNLLSTVLPVECLLPRVVDDRGRIVLIASTSELDGRGGPMPQRRPLLPDTDAILHCEPEPGGSPLTLLRRDLSPALAFSRSVATGLPIVRCSKRRRPAPSSVALEHLGTSLTS